MAERKTDEQRLHELQTRMEQLKAQKKMLEARTKKKERTSRTHRLIQLGALSEKYFNRYDIEPSQYEELLQGLVTIEQVKVLIGTDETEADT